MSPMFIGIDPGKSGGLAAVVEDGRFVAAVPMPDSERDVLDFLQMIRRSSDRVTAVLERVGASPQMGVVSAFTFGKGVGVLRMALIAAEIPFDEVTPGTWQRGVGILQKTGARSIEQKKDKNIAKRRAQELFPGLKVTHAVADALLIAEHCRRIHRGQDDLTQKG